MPPTSASSLDEDRFARIEYPVRIWAVGAVHGNADKLAALHRALLKRFAPGDRLVYLGNLLGVGDSVRETVDEAVSLRRRLLARFAGCLEARDIVYLRGAQEEMWSKLLQLQFATNPREILEWLLAHGVGPTIEAYGSTVDSARTNCRDGTMAITKWIGGLRAAIHRAPGHYQWLAGLKRAAVTDRTAGGGGLLLVHASVDPSRPLTMQGDTFWWDSGAFDQLSDRFENFARVIRGYDHNHRGVALDRPHTATVDGGCGYGGTLNAVCFAPGGAVLDQIEA